MLQDDGQGLIITGMTDAEFCRLGTFIQSQCGIKMSPSKKTMLQTRLAKRLRLLRLTSFKAYTDYLSTPEGRERELCSMIDAVTTNKTDFFREDRHFSYLTEHIPAGARLQGRPLTCWSAGCSTGEEPFTLAMVLAEYALSHPAFCYSILATDISLRVLTHAAAAIYPHEKIEPVPLPLRKKYLLRSRDGLSVRICPDLRARVAFQRLNFMDDRYALPGNLQVIFCRNVIIYFDRPTQEVILDRICRHLTPGGYLFMGHSETLSGMNLPLEFITSSIYRKRHDTH